MTTDLPFRLYAHRGASAHLPENTIAAFARAVEDGATALELDVHRSADGRFVVAHDADGRRLAADPRRIRALTMSDLAGWDVGRGFADRAGSRPHAGRGHRPPSLDEVLDAFPDLPMSVDLKPNDPSAVPALLEVLARHGAAARVTLASFHHRVLAAVRRLGYPGPTALSRLEVAWLRLLPLPQARRMVRGTAAQVPCRVGPLRLDGRRFAERCRLLGLRLDYWVVNELEEARRLVARGATGIMTDDPARLAGILSDLSRRPEVAAPDPASVAP